MRRPTVRDLLLAFGALMLGAQVSAAVTLAAPATEDEFRAYLPIALGSTPLADRVGVNSSPEWYTWGLRPTSETIIRRSRRVPTTIDSAA